jgi:S-adenosylmethionine:diacylglycerol 3-amino-3-carboxypropyl transferase
LEQNTFFNQKETQMQTKQMKRETVSKLAAVRNSRTPAQQIQELDTRLGDGVGAKKERARLAKLMQA